MVYQIQIVPMYCPNGLLSNLVSELPIQRERMKLVNLEKNRWLPPEGSAALHPEEKNPLIKLLMDDNVTRDFIRRLCSLN